MKKKPIKQIEAYNQNVQAPLIVSIIAGKVRVRIKHPIQRKIVDIAMAVPRTLLGNISEISTQVIGASDVA